MSSSVLERCFGDTCALLSMALVHGSLQLSASLLLLLVRTNSTVIPTPHQVPTF